MDDVLIGGGRLVRLFQSVVERWSQLYETVILESGVVHWDQGKFFLTRRAVYTWDSDSN